MKVAVNTSCGETLDLKALERICLEILRAEGVRTDSVLSLSVVTSREIGELNRRYLAKEGPTDVMAFSMQEECAEGFLLGDVLICPEVIEERKAQYEVENGRELEFVTAHGVLHLLGYEDGDEKGSEEMDRRQREMLDLQRRRD